MRRAALLPAAALLAALSALPGTAVAKQPTLAVRAEADLDFGALVVPSAGWRVVGATGATSSGGLMPAGASGTSPARFTVAYDRGNEGNKVLNLTIEVVLVSLPSASISGVRARLSSLDTDIPGVPRLIPGQVVRLRIANCRTRICAQTFRVGGRIDVERSSGGGRLVFPLPLVATVTAID